MSPRGSRAGWVRPPGPEGRGVSEGRGARRGSGCARCAALSPRLPSSAAPAAGAGPRREGALLAPQRPAGRRAEHMAGCGGHRGGAGGRRRLSAPPSSAEGLAAFAPLPGPSGPSDSSEEAAVPLGATRSAQPLSCPVSFHSPGCSSRPSLKKKGDGPLSLAFPAPAGRPPAPRLSCSNILAFQGTFPSCITVWPVDRCLAVILELVTRNFKNLCTYVCTPSPQGSIAFPTPLKHVGGSQTWLHI